MRLLHCSIVDGSRSDDLMLVTTVDFGSHLIRGRYELGILAV